MNYSEWLCLVLIIVWLIREQVLLKWKKRTISMTRRYRACDFVRRIYKGTLLGEALFTKYSVFSCVQEAVIVCGDAPEGWQDEL